MDRYDIMVVLESAVWIYIMGKSEWSNWSGALDIVIIMIFGALFILLISGIIKMKIFLYEKRKEEEYEMLKSRSDIINMNSILMKVVQKTESGISYNEVMRPVDRDTHTPFIYLPVKITFIMIWFFIQILWFTANEPILVIVWVGSFFFLAGHAACSNMISEFAMEINEVVE